MKSADDLHNLFKNAGLRIQPEADERVFQDMLQARQKARQNSTLTWSRWRMTMKSPITKLAVAAAVIIAVTLGLTLWRGTGSGIALADVLTQVQQITAYMYQMTMTIGGKGPTGLPMNQDVQATVLMSQDFGMKTIMNMTDPNGEKTMRQEQYMLPQEKAMIMLMPDEKKFVRMELNDTLIEKMRQQNNDPSAMLKQVVNCEHRSLGRSVIDGVEVEGFQTTDPSYLAGMGGQADVKVWVDVKTQLPVRMEMDMLISEMRMHGVMDNFQWDYPVDAATFQPVIPDDYTTLPGGPMKMPAMDEQGAIAGLKLFADLTGRYPEKLDLMSLMAELGKPRNGDMPPIAKQMAEESKGLSEDEQVKKMMDIMMPIQGAGTFYMLLVQEKKEPVYYGNVVTPQDDTQVLMRWKVSDDQYRVIFGSLHAETVDAATLAELEKSLPK
jgi:hypothetical protein